ncbi:hypothetical protein WAI453_000997 [Rhynchosporium graminicola]
MSPSLSLSHTHDDSTQSRHAMHMPWNRWHSSEVLATREAFLIRALCTYTLILHWRSTTSSFPPFFWPTILSPTSISADSIFHSIPPSSSVDQHFTR